MPVHNADIAAQFEEIADLLDIRGDNPFRIRAYRKAARTVCLMLGVLLPSCRELALTSLPRFMRSPPRAIVPC
jgi:DNA polymerase/3'-5' exonuclease PolX